jgi:hypothetical protein
MATIPARSGSQALNTIGEWSMKNLFAKLAVVLIVTVGLAACRTAPIYNVESEKFVGTAPLDERTAQIKRAGAGLGWVMEEVRPGVIQATLNIREHQAVALIDYTPTTFSIHYKNSVNLKYDGNQIHSNYNGWIQNLERAIVAQSSV